MATPAKTQRGFAAVTLLGAGMAGLSLASALRKKMPTIELQLIDPRAGYGHDKSFSYFALHTHPFESAVTHRFGKIAVFDATRALHLNLAETPYCLVPSDAFYATARAAIGVATYADTASETGELCFDSTPAPPHAGLWQTFAGGEFAVRQLGKMLALDTAVLMDFRIAQCGEASSDRGDGKHARFIYLLPLQHDRVLVQDTWISKRATPPEFDATVSVLKSHLLRFFDLELGACLRVENGAIPMAVPDALRSKSIAIGARGGWLRAATGYAFLEAQRGSEQLASWLAEGARGAVPVRTRPRLSNWMDRLFLRAIARHPEHAADWFTSMFARAPTAALVRFLGGTASMMDHFRVATALPLGSFLTALIGAGLRRKN